MNLRVAAALLLLGCVSLGCGGDARSGFCADWLERSESERRELLRDTLPGAGEAEPGYRPPHVQYVNCVANFVLDRAGAITASCRTFGDLEGAVTLARLTAHGMESCIELRQAPIQ